MRKNLPADNSLFKIGLNIRHARRKRELTLSDIARRTNLSRGLLSKIENFRTVPSLPVLSAIARSLNIGMENIVKNVGAETSAPHQLVRANRRVPVKREKSRGFKYATLLARSLGNIGFESFVLTLEPGAKRAPVSTDGDEFIFMLRGEIQFVIGKETFRLSAGDSFYFDGHVPHVPMNLTKCPAELLVIYLLKQHNTKGNHED
ncbi:MAG: XRE family transcriptional regulator [Verrucomicrobia bacterium]|nr:XRE family transcriptional regulator [Verrucomicrobiota bacterium]MBU1932122.1 XRE family transcriptional regulator [Patescibacteria group bacterium]